jgi:predicted HicB family RNase H-like nuclease
MTGKDLAYKKFTGSVETSFEDNCLFGKILFIEDSIYYEGNSPSELKAAFEAAVDNYLLHCEKTGAQPNKPFSGNFNIRIGADLHRKAAVEARKQGISLNEYCANAIKVCVEHNGIGKIQHTHEHLVKISNDSELDHIVATATSERPKTWETLVYGTAAH